MRILRPFAAAAAFVFATHGAAVAEFMAYEEAPVFYSDSKANDPVEIGRASCRERV